MRKGWLLVLSAACGSSPSVPDGAPPDATPLPAGPWTSLHKVLPSGATWCERESLTQDLLTMYASCGPTSAGGFDICELTRATTADGWGTPTVIPELSTQPWYDGAGTVAPDQLTFWLSRPADLSTGSNDDLFVSTRASISAAWGAPVAVAPLNTPDPIYDDEPRVLASGLAMTFEKGTPGNQIYYSSRTSITAAWSVSTAIAELASSDKTYDPMMSADQLQIVFTRSDATCTPSPCIRAYVATRASTVDPFGAPAPITEVNALGDEIRFLWLADDAHTLFFGVATQPGSSGTPYDLYEATR